MNENMQDKIKIHLSILEKSKPLESYCTNCGACCKAGVTIQKSHTQHRIYVNDLGCRNLVMEDGKSKCSVYNKRLKKAHWCVDTEEMLVKGLVPRDCPYVENLSGYTPSIMLDNNSYSQLIPLLKLGISKGSREPFDEAEYNDFMQK